MKFNPGGGSMNKMIKQAKQVQEQIVKMQEELKEREIQVSSAGGAVTVTINGKQELLNLTIKPEIIDLDDLEMLEDIIMVAINDAIKQSQDMVSSEMSRITGGFNIPGL